MLPPAAVGVRRVPTCWSSTRNSTRKTLAPVPAVAVAVMVNGTRGVARAVTLVLGDEMKIVGVPKAAVRLTELETVVLPRSSVTMASSAWPPGVVGV